MNKMLIVVPVYASYDLHIEFTQKTLDSIANASHINHEYDVMIVSSFCKPMYKETLKSMAKNCVFNEKNGVSIAWNTGIRYGVENKYDYIMIINNDLVFHPLALDNIVKFAQEHKEFDYWSCGEWKGDNNVEERTAINNYLKDVPVGEGFDEHPHFSSFMITPSLVEKLKEKEKLTKEPYPGLFDETFAPAYFEDNDFHQRLLVNGFRASKTATALFYHYGSRSIGVDNDLFISNRKTYEINRTYFMRKWGYDPHSKVIENDDSIRYKFIKPFENERTK